MSKNKHSLVRIYGFAVALSLALLAFVGKKQGLGPLVTVLILAGLEITFSFDNAVVNARVLQRMSKAWQTFFMTVGIFVAVFLVRVLLPIYIVAATSSTAFRTVIDLALHHPAEYAEKLHGAHHMISTFGGIFLLMIFLDFMLEHRKIKWMDWFENAMVKFGKVENASVSVGLAALLGTVYWFVPTEERLAALVSGLVGIIAYLIINALDSIESKNATHEIDVHKSLKNGIIGFLYLELIDASFSLDGVVGAFALTKDILLIAVGLGIGSLFVRSMTVHLLRRGVLQQYKYLEHGAHYAIGILALLMLLSVKTQVPEFITGGSGLVVIGLAIYHSRKEAKNDNAKPLI